MMSEFEQLQSEIIAAEEKCTRAHYNLDDPWWRWTSSNECAACKVAVIANHDDDDDDDENDDGDDGQGELTVSCTACDGSNVRDEEALRRDLFDARQECLLAKGRLLKFFFRVFYERAPEGSNEYRDFHAKVVQMLLSVRCMTAFAVLFRIYEGSVDWIDSPDYSGPLLLRLVDNMALEPVPYPDGRNLLMTQLGPCYTVEALLSFDKEQNVMHVLKTMLMAGADPDVADASGRTLLDVAVVNLSKSMVAWLLAFGARRFDARSLQVRAVEGGHASVDRLLCRHGLLDFYYEFGEMVRVAKCSSACNVAACKKWITKRFLGAFVALQTLELPALISLAILGQLIAACWTKEIERMDEICWVFNVEKNYKYRWVCTIKHFKRFV